MLTRGFYGLQSNWLPTLIAVGTVVLNAILDVAFYPVGVWGIPLATSLVNIVGVVLLVVFLRRRVGGCRSRSRDRRDRAHLGRVRRARRRRVRRSGTRSTGPSAVRPWRRSSRSALPSRSVDRLPRGLPAPARARARGSAGDRAAGRRGLDAICSRGDLAGHRRRRATRGCPAPGGRRGARRHPGRNPLPDGDRLPGGQDRVVEGGASGGARRLGDRRTRRLRACADGVVRRRRRPPGGAPDGIGSALWDAVRAHLEEAGARRMVAFGDADPGRSRSPRRRASRSKART